MSGEVNEGVQFISYEELIKEIRKMEVDEMIHFEEDD